MLKAGSNGYQKATQQAINGIEHGQKWVLVFTTLPSSMRQFQSLRESDGARLQRGEYTCQKHCSENAWAQSTLERSC